MDIPGRNNFSLCFSIYSFSYPGCLGRGGPVHDDGKKCELSREKKTPIRERRSSFFLCIVCPKKLRTEPPASKVYVTGVSFAELYNVYE